MKSLSTTSKNAHKQECFHGNDAQRPITVAFVDDDENDRQMLRHMLGKCSEFVCVGGYRSVNEAFVKIPKVCSRVVLRTCQVWALMN